MAGRLGAFEAAGKPFDAPEVVHKERGSITGKDL